MRPFDKKNSNWNQGTVMILIIYKHKNHIANKEIVDHKTHMIDVVKKWDKIANEMKVITQ